MNFSRFSIVMLLLCCAACNPRPTSLPKHNVHPNLQAVSELDPLTIHDTLEALIAEEKDTEEDRRFAYGVVATREVKSAEDALARAAIAGRLAQISGLNAASLVAETEKYARMSFEQLPTFRQGAAQRMLGTLYVLAPSYMLQQGDSEEGIEMLEQLTSKWPNTTINHLRLAEAYVALGDAESGIDHLCFCLKHKADLHKEEQKLLTALVEDVDIDSCPSW